MVMIGIDPHKRTHTAVAIDTAERVLDERLVRATSKQVPELLEWVKRLDGGDRSGRSSPPEGSAICWPSSSSPPANTSWTSPPRWRRGCGCWAPAAPTRTTRTTPARLRLPRSALRSWSRCGSRTTPRCSGWCRAGTPSLGWSYNKTACRLHALVADLVPGGISKEVVVCQARSLLADHPSIGAVAVERHALALDLVDELERLNTQRKALRKRIAVAVDASGTTLTEIFGVGDVGAAIILGQVGDVGRFRTADRFAAYNGTAPIEWSSGNPARPIHRLSRRGNRTLNHVIHIAAVTQLRHRHSPGRAYYDRKRTQGLTGRAALRSLKRRISDAIYRRLIADAAQRS